MALHRLDSIRVAVPDAARQSAFYTEAGFVSDSSGSRFGGSEGGHQVQVEENAFRRLLDVNILANDTTDLSIIKSRLTGLGIDVSMNDDTLSAVDPATRVVF